jgi:hypothetical protein
MFSFSRPFLSFKTEPGFPSWAFVWVIVKAINKKAKRNLEKGIVALVFLRECWCIGLFVKRKFNLFSFTQKIL